MNIPGKARATGYTDFYKGKARTPSIEDGAEEETDTTKMSPEDKRKAAIKRRLMKQRVGK